MNRITKLLILIILSCSVYFIYQINNNSVIKIANIGDSLSLGINSYGIKEYNYVDYYKDYLKRNNHQVKINNDYSIKDQSINNLLLGIKTNPKLKNTISESNIIILTVGYNDLVYKLSTEENLNNNKYKNIINEISNNYNDLIEEIRKYNKKEVIVIGYYHSNKDNYYLNKGIRDINEIIKSNQKNKYLDTYNLLSDREKYFSNPHSNYPNRLAYQAISKKIIIKTLEKSKNI